MTGAKKKHEVWSVYVADIPLSYIGALYIYRERDILDILSTHI